MTAGVASLLLATRDVAGQTILGGGPSAFVVPRGVVRVGATQEWASYTGTFGAAGSAGSERVALGDRFSADALGPRQLFLLAPVERDLQTLAGQPALALSLGRTVVTSSVSTRRTALELEAGLGRGISFGVVVPVVRTLSAIGIATNAGAGNASVGLNPARVTATAAAASTRNAAVLGQFSAAAQQLQPRYARCVTNPSTDAACGDVVSLYESAAAYAATLGRVYGVAVGGGAPVVPITGSAAQQAVNATVQGYSSRFARLLGLASDAGPITNTVQGATPLTEGGLQALLTAESVGYAQDSLRSLARLALGDIEVGVRVRLIDSFRGSEARRLAPAGHNVRSIVAATVRIGTGHVDAANDLTDVGTGDGQNDVEVASVTDLLFGARAWLSIAARYGRQLADEIPRRVPVVATDAYLPAYALQTVQRDLGDYVQVEATPRYAITSAYGVEARYMYRRKQADTYSGTFAVPDSVSGTTGLTLDAATLGENSAQHEQRIGAGVTYSTYAAYARGRARLPLEISLSYMRAISGTGATPAVSLAQLQLRAFPRFFGADWRPPRAARR